MAGGNWMRVNRGSQAESLFATPGQHSPWLEWQTLLEADPEVILLLPCGFKIAQTIADLRLLNQVGRTYGPWAVESISLMDTISLIGPESRLARSAKSLRFSSRLFHLLAIAA